MKRSLVGRAGAALALALCLALPALVAPVLAAGPDFS
jgi:hypothetical protein